MAEQVGARLVSSSKSSDSHLAVQLHPLVILTISDYVTRHILREQSGPIVGAILGAQNGRDISMEHAFECKLDEAAGGGGGGGYVLHAAWFAERLQQYRDVHKDPPLDLVGWFALTSSAGPELQHVPVHKQLLEQYNESALFLAFHPTSTADASPTSGKLPLTIFESLYEAGNESPGTAGQDAGDLAQLELRFKELPYTVDTGEAEMIGVDTIAKAGVRGSSRKADEESTLQTTKGKKRVAGSDLGKDSSSSTAGAGTVDYLSAEDDSRIANLASKVNATRMLKQRIGLLRKYLESVPSCYLNDASATAREARPEISHNILRSIASLVARLPLVAPSTPSAAGSGSNDTVYRREAAAEATDVALVSLLGSLGSLLEDAQGLGKKNGVVESQLARVKPVATGVPPLRFQPLVDQGVHMEDDDEDGDSVMAEGKA